MEPSVLKLIKEVGLQRRSLNALSTQAWTSKHANKKEKLIRKKSRSFIQRDNEPSSNTWWLLIYIPNLIKQQDKD